MQPARETPPPPWLRLILHGATFGAVAGFILFTAVDSEPLLATPGEFLSWLGSYLLAGLFSGIVAAGVIHSCRRRSWTTRLAWPLAALAGGVAFFVFGWLDTGSPRLGVELAAIWSIGWLIFLWNRRSL